MDFAALSLVYGLLLALLLTRPALRGGRLRWHRRLHALVAVLLGVWCWTALQLAHPPGVPRADTRAAWWLDALGMLALLGALHALAAAPRGVRLRRVGLGLGAACFAAAAGWFQLAVRAQSEVDPALSATLRELWGGSYAPAAALCLVHALASALFLAWGLAAPELHENEPAWRRDDVMLLPSVTALALIVLLPAI